MDTQYCHIGDGVLEKVSQLFQSEWGGVYRPLIVADGNTWQVAGPFLQERFERAASDNPEKNLWPGTPYLFPATPMLYGDERSIAEVRRLLDGNDLLAVALGSGTINDIVKRASYECGKPYIVVATAPSVDGYTSFGAAVSIGGFKQTLPCFAPFAVFAERDILCGAPLPMLSAGYGDLAAKVPAGADWLIADALGIHPVQPDIWNMIQPPLKSVLSRPSELSARNKEVVGEVFSGLVQTGFAMQKMHDSRPASGAEHLISHVWEMEHLCKDGVPVSHGFKVALGTLISTAMMDELCNFTSEQLAQSCRHAVPVSWDERAAQIQAWVGDRPSYHQILEVSRSKFLEGESLEERRRLIIHEWETIRTKIQRQIIPFADLKKMFALAGCPTEPSHIDVTKELFQRGVVVSQMIRSRYTILDLLYETGLFDQITGTLMDGTKYFHSYRR
jgi:glycerol-1-phosphate dehydrogenase [NAD(P)+]